MNNFIIFHYKDHDGLLSGWITFLGLHSEAFMVPYHYGEPIDAINRIPHGSKVYMVDVSLEPEDMVRLAERTYLTWIDHHDLANKTISPLLEGKATVIYGTLAACRLCWRHFYPKDKELLLLELLGRYDVFDKSDMEAWNERLLPFEYAVRGLGLTEPKGFADPKFYDEERIEQMIREGKVLLSYLQTRANKNAEAALILDWEGQKCMVISGETGDFWYHTPKYLEERPDMLVFPFFSIEKGLWTIGLRRGIGDVDCSLIAKKYGGGGHRAASGFRVKELPF